MSQVARGTKFSFPKAPSGIAGLDDITEGGLPRGRVTLVCGKAGSGKTLLGMQFLVKGATEYGEPGVFMSFEESGRDLEENVASLGFDLPTLEKEGKIAVEYVKIDRAEIEETGEYDLEALFIRLGFAIDSVGAKRVAVDTIESLFSSFCNEGILRAELRRLFRWLKDRGVTAVVTGESGEKTLTRYGLEEYISDCVILLDHRVDDQISTRRLRIVKYRGSTHGTNEYPFLIEEEGVTVMPITSLSLDHEVSSERVSTGIPRLDTMLGGGVYRGSSVMFTGTPGAGKTSLAASFVDAACKRGERCLYIAFEESPNQIARNMRSIGIDLESHVRAGLLRIQAARPTLHGIETHLAIMLKAINEFEPSVVVVDPITNMVAVSTQRDVKAMMTRLIDHIKARLITAVLTDLTPIGTEDRSADVGISSWIDTWIYVTEIESNGERNRVLYLLKSRGMAHSNQVREMVISDDGINLRDVYLGPEGVLTGTARYLQEAKDKENVQQVEGEVARKQLQIERRRRMMEAQIQQIQAEFETAKATLEQEIREEREAAGAKTANLSMVAEMRKADRNTPEDKEMP